MPRQFAEFTIDYEKSTSWFLNVSAHSILQRLLIPIEAQWKLLQPLKRRLQTPVKKAAKQLKETKRAFNREKDAGLFILVNEGSALFRPSAVFYFLHHLFQGGYSNIDQVVYCSVNVAASVPGIPDGARIWFTGSVSDKKRVADSFLKLLRSCWRGTLEQKLGVKLPALRFDSDPKLVDEVVFDKIDFRVAMSDSETVRGGK